MILKDKKLCSVKTAKSIAGQQHEKDVAFYLRRAFKDHKQVFVINDYNFSHNNENAQIDHLIVYKYGFVLVESKSIKGRVSVNANGEWSRTVGNTWTGMPSPIKQVELQQKLFRELLFEHRGSILPKLFGISLQSFGMRQWHNLCAVSNNSIIDRKTIPNEISNQVVKAEFIADKVIEVMTLKRGFLQTLKLDACPDFSNSELKSITSFLLSTNTLEKTTTDTLTKTPTISPKTQQGHSNEVFSPIVQCKQCADSKHLSPKYGKFGYYVNCGKCNANTSLKRPCPTCNSKKTKISKQKETYSVNCEDCESKVRLI